MSTDAGTGLTHIGAREYDPSIGQFISVDPVFAADQHQSLNGYVYANNNPVTFSDPTGLWLDDGTGHNEQHPDANGPPPANQGVPRGGTGTGGCYYTCGDSGGDNGVLGDTRDAARSAATQIYDAVSFYAISDSRREAWLAAYRAEMQKKYEQDSIVDANTVIATAVNVCYVHKEIGCSQQMRDYFQDVEAARLPGFGLYEDGFRGPNPEMVAAKTDLGRALSSRSCKCFLAGTDVLMADGTTKDIEDIKLGDKVQATDPETGETSPREVTRLIVTEDDKHFNELSIATVDGVEQLTATYEHPFWSPSEKRWIEARQLEAGMTLLADDGDTAIVTSNRSFAERARTYNLTIEELHTYYVLAGRTPVLVHNARGCKTFLIGTSNGIDEFLKKHGEDGFGTDKMAIQGTADKGRSGTGGWNWTRNKRWLDEALASGSTVRMVNNPNKPIYEEGNVYQRELKYLKDKGYGWREVGEYWEVYKIRP
jgi:RHS repeat-associated protein